MRAKLYERILGLFARATARVRVWYRLPFPIAMATLLGTRVNERWHNLFNTQTEPVPPAPATSDVKHQRSADGAYNDLGEPWMGSAGARFGRNMPILETFAEEAPRLYEPNPRVISEQLLARTTFAPVPHLNVLVAAWLQFMVHDWLSHGVNDTETPPHDIPLPPGDPWPHPPLTVLRSRAEPAGPADAGRPATYANTETHWWDGSQIYGSSLAQQIRIRTDPATGAMRTDGKIGLTADGHLPIDTEAKIGGLELAGVNGNWWLGLSVMQTLFAREHNAIVDRLAIDYPGQDGEWLFQKARLVNAALIAKIHTVEWTPALMNSPEGHFVMRDNWWGILGEHYRRAYGRLSDSEVVSGIMGSTTDHHAAPYAMTEEFVACYRMHSLIPDSFSIREPHNDAERFEVPMAEAAHAGPPKIYARASFDEVMYSLATSHPGALGLHNYPDALRMLPEDAAKGIYIDLATVDILRDRERGIPRYCKFRELLGMKVPKSFEELTDDAAWQKDLKSVYARVEDVDLLVGTLAESRSKNAQPTGFGFGDTVFRIFILMASRRLKSDRFFTTDFNEETYTPAGFAWVADNTLRSVMTRHCAALAPHFSDARNMFFPWAKGTA